MGEVAERVQFENNEQKLPAPKIFLQHFLFPKHDFQETHQYCKALAFLTELSEPQRPFVFTNKQNIFGETQRSSCLEVLQHCDKLLLSICI